MQHPTLALMPKALFVAALMLGVAGATGGCTTVALSLVGAGAGATVNHRMNAVAARTFSEPLPKVRKAAQTALARMAIRTETSVVSREGITTIQAVAGNRRIEIEIESLTGSMTRVRALAKVDLLQMDRATAQEIIAQTEKALARG